MSHSLQPIRCQRRFWSLLVLLLTYFACLASFASFAIAPFTVNLLNQITSRDASGYADVMGLDLATNTVKVNGTNAYQKWEYFREQVGTNNTTAAQWMGINVSAPGQTTVSGHEFIAQTPESFTYDADGNLTNDGRWTYTWDGENRLVNMTSLSNGPAGSLLKLDFGYDFAGRRVQKLVSTNQAGTTNYAAQYTNRFVYDGWNLVAVLNPNSSLAASFIWGLDVSGTPWGAGGVGGLLAENLVGSGVQFVANDGMGNVAALVSAANGTKTAAYEYDPFGGELRVSGAMAKANPIRFSSKYTDDESDFNYYGYRYYKPSAGGWLNRDPIEEAGGFNLYGFVGNNPVNAEVCYGLWWLGDYASWVGKGFYDFLMGDNNGYGNPNSYGALRAAELGGIDPHNNVLRDAFGLGGQMAGDAGQKLAEVAALNALGGIAGEILDGAPALIGLGKFCTAGKTAANPWVMGTYREMQALTDGENGLLQAHHILEERHLLRWGLDTMDAPAVVLSQEEHWALNALLQKTLPYGTRYTPEQVWAAYQQVYVEAPEWLDAISPYFP